MNGLFDKLAQWGLMDKKLFLKRIYFLLSNFDFEKEKHFYIVIYLSLKDQVNSRIDTLKIRI